MPVNTVQFQSGIKFISRDGAGSKPMVIPCVSPCRVMRLVLLYDQAESRASNFATEKRTRAGAGGGSFQPVSSPNPPFHLAVQLPSTVKSPFFPSLSLPTRGTEKFDSGHRTSVSISGSCHRPVALQSMHVSNILNHLTEKKEKKKKMYLPPVVILLFVIKVACAKAFV